MERFLSKADRSVGALFQEFGKTPPSLLQKYEKYVKHPADTAGNNSLPPPPYPAEEPESKDAETAGTSDSKLALEADDKIDTADSDAASSSLSSVFDSDAGKLVVDEIKKLSQTAVSISKDFDRIRTLLVEVDLERDVEDSEKLTPRWKTYQERYDRYLKQSKTTALKAKAAASEYVMFMREIKNGGRKFVMDEMPAFIKSHLDNIRESSEAAGSASLDFTGLVRDIQDFAVVLNHVNATVIDGKAKATRDRMEVIIDEVADIDKGLKRLEALIKTSTETLDSSGLGFGCAAILCATVILAPFVIARLYRDRVKKHFATTVLEKATHDAEEQNQLRASKMQELAELKRRAEHLEQLQADIRESRLTIERLCNALGVIGNIWSYLEKDAMQVEAGLLSAQQSQISQSIYFTKLKLGNKFTCNVYSRMAEILGVYAAQIV